jgi:phosphate transport system substrate-binding protein
MKKSVTSITFSVMVLFSFITGCSTTGEDQKNNKDSLHGTISISGAFALYPMCVKWQEEFQKLNPGVRIDVSAGGAGKGMADALSGMVDLGMVSRSVSPEEVAKGAWYVSVTKDAVLPTVNGKNPFLKQLREKGLTQDQLISIYMNGTLADWGKAAGINKKIKINVFNRSDACGAAEMWAKYLGGKQEDLKGIGVYGDPGMAEALKKDPNGIGFNNVIFAFDIKTGKAYEGLAVVPIDLNGNGTIDSTENFYGSLSQITEAIRNGSYPSPPARELYFVCKGKPADPIVVAFLNWILTDGQKYVTESGYVKLPDERLREELKKL